MVQGRKVETRGNVYVDGVRRSWQEIDRDLRAIAKRQRALDAEEATLLCTVVRREIWRELGRASLLVYLEEVLGYGPKAAKERVRIALALDELPMLAETLASGEQSYSAIRELTRVATAQTQAEWCEAARNKNVRQIEELVSCHRRGDRPSDPPVPDRQRCTVPGCRAARHIDVHHVVPRHLGGGHEPENLTLLCSGHHRALHDGLLTITGLAPKLEVTWKYLPQTDVSSQLPHVGRAANPSATTTATSPPVAASNYALVVLKTEAAMALAQMGFTKQEARAVVDEAANRLPFGASFDQLVRAALKLTRR